MRVAIVGIGAIQAVAIANILMAVEKSVVFGETIEIKKPEGWDFKDIALPRITEFDPDLLKKSRGKGKIKRW